MTSLAERAVKVAEEANETTKKYEELLPAYFFFAYILGLSNTKIEEIKEVETREFILDLLRRGGKFWEKSINSKNCKKCDKEMNLQDGAKFCQFCGEKTQ